MVICFIGGGNMASALISGLVAKAPGVHEIRVSDPSPDARARLESEFGAQGFTDSVQAATGADVIVLAVKPQIMPIVLEGLSGRISPEQCVLSIAAGTTIESMQHGLGEHPAVVRSMPNTPALLGQGISGLCASEGCSDSQRSNAEAILKAAGEVVWVDDESLMDAVTAVSGSGPAYFFLIVEAMTNAGIRLGLEPGAAARLAARTCLGAGYMMTSGEETPEVLRHRVTSPGGTTQAALEQFEENGLRDLVDRALTAARDRGRELAGGGN